MKRNNIKFTSVMLLGLLSVGCANKATENKKSGFINTESLKAESYRIDISLDNARHSFKDEDMRPIIRAFTEIHQGMSPDSVKNLFYTVGEVTTSDIYTIKPSEYEMFDVSVVNDNNEEVMATFKDGTLISKVYKKDTFNESNKNTAYVNYYSNLFDIEYSSGVFLEDEKINVAENKNVWLIEEELFKYFNK